MKHEKGLGGEVQCEVTMSPTERSIQWQPWWEVLGSQK